MDAGIKQICTMGREAQRGIHRNHTAQTEGPALDALNWTLLSKVVNCSLKCSNLKRVNRKGRARRQPTFSMVSTSVAQKDTINVVGNSMNTTTPVSTSPSKNQRDALQLQFKGSFLDVPALSCISADDRSRETHLLQSETSPDHEACGKSSLGQDVSFR